jgi:hypothetical protein
MIVEKGSAKLFVSRVSKVISCEGIVITRSVRPVLAWRAAAARSPAPYGTGLTGKPYINRLKSRFKMVKCEGNCRF